MGLRSGTLFDAVLRCWPTPSPPGVFWGQNLWIQWFAGGWCLQNIDSRRVAAKILVINRLVLVRVYSRGFGGRCFLSTVLSIAGWMKLKCQLDFLLFVGVRRLWDLKCD